MKKFSTRDGMGTHLWAKAGRQLAIVTGENSPIVLRRAEKLRISEVHLGISDKKSVSYLMAIGRRDNVVVQVGFVPVPGHTLGSGDFTDLAERALDRIANLPNK